MESLSFFNFEFNSPWFLWLFLLLIPLAFMDASKKRRKGIIVPTIQAMQEDRRILLVMFLLKISKYIILSCLIIAMARPRTFTVSENQDDTKGVDIMMTVDVSLSMLARDLEPDRITVLQNISKRFVDKRSNDRLGLVVYASEAFVKVPLTSDHVVMLDELSTLSTNELQNGTAIGEGLVVAVNHLKNSKAKSKIIILMTDGENNILNSMDTILAAKLAKDYGIKVYTIGIGTNGYALMPTQQDIFGDLIYTEVQVSIDEDLLKEIADITGGKYFRASSNQGLENIYNEIDRLEKSDVNTDKSYNYKEYFRYFLCIALAVLVVDMLLRWVIFKFLN